VHLYSKSHKHAITCITIIPHTVLFRPCACKQELVKDARQGLAVSMHA
jgi:hypothetical protein